MKRQTIAALSAAAVCVSGIFGVASASGNLVARNASERSPEILASLLSGTGVDDEQQGLYRMRLLTDRNAS